MLFFADIFSVLKRNILKFWIQSDLKKKKKPLYL